MTGGRKIVEKVDLGRDSRSFFWDFIEVPSFGIMNVILKLW